MINSLQEVTGDLKSCKITKMSILQEPEFKLNLCMVTKTTSHIDLFQKS